MSKALFRRRRVKKKPPKNAPHLVAEVDSWFVIKQAEVKDRLRTVKDFYRRAIIATHAIRPGLPTLLHARLRLRDPERSTAEDILCDPGARKVLIRTPNDKWVVIDVGQDKLQAEMMKDEWDVDEVALAIVSHRHYDHFGGMRKVIEI